MSQGKIELVGEDPRNEATSVAVTSKLHDFLIRYNPETQTIEDLKFSGGPTGEFKTWEFIIAILEMAKQRASFALEVTRAQNMQVAAQQQMQAAALANQLQHNGGPRRRL